LFSGGALDGVGQPVPLPGHLPALLVVPNQRLHELHRVLPDDLADRGAVRGRRSNRSATSSSSDAALSASIGPKCSRYRWMASTVVR
jgi:hypothetical protein